MKEWSIQFGSLDLKQHKIGSQSKMRRSILHNTRLHPFTSCKMNCTMIVWTRGSGQGQVKKHVGLVGQRRTRGFVLLWAWSCFEVHCSRTEIFSSEARWSSFRQKVRTWQTVSTAQCSEDHAPRALPAHGLVGGCTWVSFSFFFEIFDFSACLL